MRALTATLLCAALLPGLAAAEPRALPADQQRVELRH